MTRTTVDDGLAASDRLEKIREICDQWLVGRMAQEDVLFELSRILEVETEKIGRQG
jgi:hypothetical protein